MSLHAQSIKAHMLRTHSRLTSNTPPRGNAHPAAGDDSRCRRWYLARLSRAGRRIYCTIGYSDGVSRWDLGVIQRAGFVRAFQDRLEKTTKTARTTVASGHKIWQYVGPLGSGDIPPVCLAGCFELLFPERRGIRCIRDKNMTCSTSCETSKSLLFKIAFHIPGELKVILSFSGHCAFLSERGLNNVFDVSPQRLCVVSQVWSRVNWACLSYRACLVNHIYACWRRDDEVRSLTLINRAEPDREQMDIVRSLYANTGLRCK